MLLFLNCFIILFMLCYVLCYSFKIGTQIVGQVDAVVCELISPEACGLLGESCISVSVE